MKNTILFTLFFFCLGTLQAELLKPQPCSTCNYGFKKLGTRNLVGGTRNYYGSEKREKSDSLYTVKPDTTDRKLLISDVYPGMNGKALFWNFDETGTAHLTELDSSVIVFRRNGITFAWACENRLEICSYGTTGDKPEDDPKPDPKDDKTYDPGMIEHHHTGTIDHNHKWVDEEEAEEVFEPKECDYCHKYECICGGLEYRGTTIVRPNQYKLSSPEDPNSRKDSRYWRYDGWKWVYDPIPYNCRKLGCSHGNHVCGSGNNYGSSKSCGHSYHQNGQCDNGSYQSGQYYNNGSGNYPRCRYERRGGVRVRVHVHVAGAVCIR